MKLLPTRKILLVAIALALGVSIADSCDAQLIRHGSPVPAELKGLYEKGLGYLVSSQASNGSWSNNAGVTAICLMALIASGEDLNFGRYKDSVQKSTRFLIENQDGTTGLIRGGRMYAHGFVMLALADVYGVVDDELVWKGTTQGRTVGEALELAVRCAVNAQKKNPFGAWRYTPTSRDADTSVSGAVLMGLLAARNAGVEVPDESIDNAVEYFVSMTSESGTVAYSGVGGFGSSMARSSICNLVVAVAKRKDLDVHRYTLEYLKDHLDAQPPMHPFYFRYYMAQALFQSDYDAWARWNEANTRLMLDTQSPDGSIGNGAGHGKAYSTGMMLLSAALNYCFLPIYER